MGNPTKKVAQQFQPGNKHRAALGEQLQAAAAELRGHAPGKTAPSLPARIEPADISAMAERLNSMPKIFDEMEKEEMYKAWDHLEAMGNSTIWTRGHLALSLSKKYGDNSISEFAEAKGLGKSSVYRYMKLAELFPKVDKILEPSFFFRAIELARGRDEKAVKMIEEAREKKKENKRYSVRDFTAEMSKPSEKGDGKITHSTKTILSKLAELAKQLKSAKDIAEHDKEVDQLKKALAWLFEK